MDVVQELEDGPALPDSWKFPRELRTHFYELRIELQRRRLLTVH